MPIYEVVLKVDGYEYHEAVSAYTAQDAVDLAVKIHNAGRKRALIEVESVKLVKVVS